MLLDVAPISALTVMLFEPVPEATFRVATPLTAIGSPSVVSATLYSAYSRFDGCVSEPGISR